MKKSKPLYVYDPKTNITTKTTHKEMVINTGTSPSSITHAKQNRSKLKIIDCYVSEHEFPLKERHDMYSKENYSDEHFKIVDGSDGRYKISNYGRVKRVFKHSERFCLPFLRGGNTRNLFVKIRFLGKYADVKVGHVVAHHFIRPRKEGESVFRKNGIVTDDCASNLEYVTRKELGKRTGHKATSKPVVKICKETSIILDEYRSAREAGRDNFLSYQTVSDNCNGVTKSAAGINFMYLHDYEKLAIGDYEVDCIEN